MLKISALALGVGFFGCTDNGTDSPKIQDLKAWSDTFGGTENEIGFSVQPTTDGGYIVTGFTNSSGAGKSDVYLLRTDANGVALAGWPKTFGGPENDGGYDVKQTSDGGFVIAGSTSSSGAGQSDVYLLRTNSKGEVLKGWPKTYGGLGYELAYSVALTNDGGFILAGSTDDTSDFVQSDAYLVRTDGNGTLLSGWPKAFGGSSREALYSIQQTTDGGFVMAGQTWSEPGGGYLVRTDAQGTPLPGWPKSYGDPGWTTSARSVQQTSDGGFVMTGYTDSVAGMNYQVYLVRTDVEGAVLAGWPKNYGGNSGDYGQSVQQTKDGGFILVGGTMPGSSDSADVYLLRTDENGVVMPGWPKTFGGAREDFGFGVRQTEDSGFIVAGRTASSGKGGDDIYLIKTDPFGNAE